MAYPQGLIPRSYYRIFSIDELDYKKRDYYLVRKSLKSTEAETFDRFGFVKVASLIPTDEKGILSVKEVPGLSKNLLGGKFKLEHLSYSPSMKESSYWEGKETPIPADEILNNITKDSTSIPIFFEISKIHGRTSPYFRKIDQHYKKKLPEDLKKPDATVNISFVTEILHKPTICNFWHVEFSLKDQATGDYFKKKNTSTPNPEKPVEEQNVGTQVAMLALELFLLVSATPELKKAQKIPAKAYIKFFNDASVWLSKFLPKTKAD